MKIIQKIILGIFVSFISGTVILFFIDILCRLFPTINKFWEKFLENFPGDTKLFLLLVIGGITYYFFSKYFLQKKDKDD